MHRRGVAGGLLGLIDAVTFSPLRGVDEFAFESFFAGDDDPFNAAKVTRMEPLMQKGLSYQQARMVVGSLEWIFDDIADSPDAEQGGGRQGDEIVDAGDEHGVSRRGSLAGKEPLDGDDFAEGVDREKLPVGALLYPEPEISQHWRGYVLFLKILDPRP
jgi:hypothetical protein